MNYMKGTALQAAAISSLPFHMGIPAYFSDPSIEAFHGKRGFFGMFYSIMEKDWKDAKITIPDVDYSVRLPPLISILLDRVNSRDQIPDTLSELRQELEPIRTEMLTFSENMRRSVGENQIEEACKHIRSSFEATFSASRQRKYGAMILRLLQTYKALRSPFDLVIKTLNSEYKPEDPRIVANRTTTGKMFSELLRTDSMYSLLSNLFTKSEIKAMEGTAPR